MDRLLPRIVYQMSVHGALIVGSQAKVMAGDDLEVDLNDWDLLVPYEKWPVVSLLIPLENSNVRPNKFGGWRFESDFKGETIEVDVWPSSVEHYLANCKTKHGGAVRVVDFINDRVYSAQYQELV